MRGATSVPGAAADLVPPTPPRVLQPAFRPLPHAGDCFVEVSVHLRDPFVVLPPHSRHGGVVRLGLRLGRGGSPRTARSLCAGRRATPWAQRIVGGWSTERVEERPVEEAVERVEARPVEEVLERLEAHPAEEVVVRHGGGAAWRERGLARRGVARTSPRSSRSRWGRFWPASWRGSRRACLPSTRFGLRWRRGVPRRGRCSRFRPRFRAGRWARRRLGGAHGRALRSSQLREVGVAVVPGEGVPGTHQAGRRVRVASAGAGVGVHLADAGAERGHDLGGVRRLAHAQHREVVDAGVQIVVVVGASGQRSGGRGLEPTPKPLALPDPENVSGGTTSTSGGSASSRAVRPTSAATRRRRTRRTA